MDPYKEIVNRQQITLAFGGPAAADPVVATAIDGSVLIAVVGAPTDAVAFDVATAVGVADDGWVATVVAVVVAGFAVAAGTTGSALRFRPMTFVDDVRALSPLFVSSDSYWVHRRFSENGQ